MLGQGTIRYVRPVAIITEDWFNDDHFHYLLEEIRSAVKSGNLTKEEEAVANLKDYMGRIEFYKFIYTNTEIAKRLTYTISINGDLQHFIRLLSPSIYSSLKTYGVSMCNDMIDTLRYEVDDVYAKSENDVESDIKEYKSRPYLVMDSDGYLYLIKTLLTNTDKEFRSNVVYDKIIEQYLENSESIIGKTNVLYNHLTQQ
jgi:hypothetical protein